MYNFLKTTTFICNIFSRPIKFGQKIEFLIFSSIYHDIISKTVYFIKKWSKWFRIEFVRQNEFLIFNNKNV